MPKINVYLPDDLADSVKELGLPVSAICQRALEQSVKRVSAIRAVGDLGDVDPTVGLTSFTQRARDVLKLAIAAARDRGVDDVDPTRVLAEVRQLLSKSENGRAARMGATAANALELAVVEALTLGHNYVGCEHLLLGLVAEPDGAGGEVLRGLGVESRQARQMVSALLAGYAHLRANQGEDAITVALGKALEPVLRRLDRIEEQAGLK
jgi:hypothetical protein